MAILQHSSATHLAEIFKASQEEIITEWRAHSEVLLRELRLDKPTITDHLPDIITEIVRDLAGHRTGPLSAEHSSGSPPVHGVQRFHDGLDVGEVVAEYNLLRDAFTTVAGRHGFYVVGEAARIINLRVDEAVRMAVMSFAAQQAFIRKEQEDNHLAFVAHDLRTPLNAAGLLVTELREILDAKALAETEELLGLIERNLHRVELLVKKVLDAKAPVRNGNSFQPERRTFELWPLVQRLILDLRALSAQNAIEVLNHVPPTLSVFADAGLISQVFQNLLGNAFKYAGSGRVIVSASADAGGCVTCAVQDNGAGIPLELLSTVFHKLTTDPEKTGTGLGLAIVKQIVEAHGGTVCAESEQGKGAKFVFTVPCVTEPSRP